MNVHGFLGSPLEIEAGVGRTGGGVRDERDSAKEVQADRTGTPGRTVLTAKTEPGRSARMLWLTKGRYLPIIFLVRRKQGALLPIEAAILAAGLDLRRKGSAEFYGFAIAKRMEEIGAAHQLTAHGTLYKALGRLKAAGLLESRWEEADLALAEGRPRRRLYTVTGVGERTLATIVAEREHRVMRPRTGLASP